MKTQNGIIFDLDGTLWDSSEQVGIAWNSVFSRNDIDVILTAENMAVMMGRTVPEIGEALLPNMELSQRKSILQQCCEEENRRLETYGGILYEGVVDCLKMLSNRFFIAIVSNCEDGYIQAFLKYHGVSEFVSDFECIGRTGKHKGENIRLVIDRNNLAKAVYIGDTERDMLSAQYAGIPFVHASYGFNKNVDASYSITTMKELPSVIDTILKKQNERDSALMSLQM